uniref:Uncharacterized protein n=1 Tax=Arundo donax TaxID=35708 RepID=A0A0A9DIE3_ARUDO
MPTLLSSKSPVVIEYRRGICADIFHVRTEETSKVLCIRDLRERKIEASTKQQRMSHKINQKDSLVHQPAVPRLSPGA